MASLVGSWKLEESDNFDEVLKELGIYMIEIGILHDVYFKGYITYTIYIRCGICVEKVG